MLCVFAELLVCTRCVCTLLCVFGELLVCTRRVCVCDVCMQPNLKEVLSAVQDVNMCVCDQSIWNAGTYSRMVFIAIIKEVFVQIESGSL